ALARFSSALARAKAAAEEQYFRARVQEMRAKVIEAEAQVPMAIAEAFRLGNLGIMDYYRLQNMEADTRMRQSFSDLDDKPADDEDTTGSIDRDSPNS
ncbi:MAG: flotillin-like FloA family protein, partial [Bacteroidota bacterium]